MKNGGFTLIEVLVGTALFLVVATAFYGAFTSLFQLASGSQARTLAVELADEQFEIVRNMPYINVGLTNDTIETPYGILPPTQNLTRGGYTFTVNLTVRNINLSTSTVQASDKLVEVDVECPTCKDFQPVVLTGQVSPANLQSASNGGAIVVHVIDANGNPVEDATVNVQSLATSTVHDTDVTDNNGALNIIGVPAGANMYRITVTKSGYSSDRTYPVGGSGNPSPNNADATVINQQVTNTSFSIDKLSSLNFTSVSPTCVPLGGIGFSMVGSKLIGTGVTKYPTTNLSTNSGGILNLNNMEWDTYSITPTATTYDIEGINPFSPLTLHPNNAQNVQFVVVPHNQNSLMVSVMGSSSKLPISNATVRLTGPGNYDQTFITGEGYLSQSNWSHGSGQTGSYTDPKAYAADNGGVDTNTSTSSGNIVLHWNAVGDPYNRNATGTLESSTFDMGTTSNFYTLNWAPGNQRLLAGLAPVKFQFATAQVSGGPWNYLGPDGTAGTFFSVSGGSINSSQNNNEFARYMAYLTTNTATVTPMVSNVSFSYTSGCIPPGQVLFQGLGTGSYSLSVSVPAGGYANYSGSVTVSNAGSGWQQQTVSLGPPTH
jgi:prepilin-type N-terminal cleavage/methylation domain-containing protein